MIKKYITLAALLSAGTALANAATKWVDAGVGNVTITTTFNNTSSASDINGAGATVSVGGLFSSGANINSTSSSYTLNSGGEAAAKYQSIVPNFDITKDDAWRLSFTYSLGSLISQVAGRYSMGGVNHQLKIESVELKLGAVDTNGHFVDKSKTNYYDFTLSLTPTGSAALSTGLQGKEVRGSGQSALLRGEGPQDNPIVFDFSSLGSSLQSPILTGTTNFTLLVKGAYGSVPGSIGIQSITFNTSVVKQVPVEDPVTPGNPNVPEPSAFGLLAGLGALALVASRRRRK